MGQQKTLVWFRQDLRIIDNPALQYGCENGSIIPLFIYDTTAPNMAALGGASKWWLHHSLLSLQKQLSSKLVVMKGDPKTIIMSLLNDVNSSSVVWNRCYEPWQIKRDSILKKQLAEENINAKSFNGSLLWEPMSITKADGTPYKVFTPYYRRGCLNAKSPRYPFCVPEKMDIENHTHKGINIESLTLMPEVKWYKKIGETWVPGEEGAKSRLTDFLEGRVTHYKDQRNLPSVKGTSMLSPHLHWGEISVNQIWYATLDKFGGMENEGVDTFLSELGWREFSYYLLYHFPDLPTKNFSKKFDTFAWRYNKFDLEKWQCGQTGIPIIDAGMRELWQTGYMHNRVRMVVGSFLVKNLLIDWREGERWFWDCLCDADMASNSASWQWVAGCGADAAPYFRIFNPVLQGEKFDKEGEYVRHYCPELINLPNKFIHKPWDAPDSVLDEAGITLGIHYPSPIVDLKESRKRALEAFDTSKRENNAS